MYLDYFGLVSDPFALSPNPNLLFLSQSHEEAMAHLAYGLEQGEEIILLTGSIGMGKTLAVQCLENRISSKFHCIVVSSTNMEFRDLLKLILLDLSISITPNPDLADLHIAFKKMLQNEHEKGRNLLLIIDEAQNLSPDSLESFRLLLSIAPSGNTNLNIVFAGQPGLNQLINLPELAQLRQRIRVHYHMEPLSKKEIKSYLNFRTNECGQEKHLFKDNAIDAIFELSKGVPRLVNHLASQALLSAYVDEASVVVRKHLSEVELPGEVEDSKIVSDHQSLSQTNSSASKKTPRPTVAPINPPAPEKKSNRRGIWIFLFIIAAIGALFFFPPINSYISSLFNQQNSIVPTTISKKVKSDSNLSSENNSVESLSSNTPTSKEAENPSAILLARSSA